VSVEEQAALRRVATLVARGAPPPEVFAAVTEEAGRLVGADLAGMSRYDPDDTQTVVAAWPADRERIVPGTRLPVSEGVNLARSVRETGRSARVDDWAGAAGPVADEVRELGVRASVASPIVVAGSLWGLMIVDSRRGPFPEGTEERLAGFTELVATAVANSEARAELQRLADEQTALRRVATLVAGEPSSAALFAAVAAEVGGVLAADLTRVLRYEPDGSTTVVGEWSKPGVELPPDAGVRSSVGASVVVEDRAWGVVIAGTADGQPLAPDSQSRIAQFTELVATAIANADSRAKLAASRTRVVAAADAERHRIERNLHDGAQQRLVSVGLQLRAAEAAAPPDLLELREELSSAASSLTGVVEELREISRGLHPPILSEGGLAPALRALARRSAVPVALTVHVPDRLAESIEVAAYYVTAEALANVAKHAHAGAVSIDAEQRDGVVELRIRDDGVGGADPGHGSGLVGIMDRVEALGGHLEVVSPAGEGTSLYAELPTGSHEGPTRP
jgi:signal transduction histidine kinase